MKKKNLQPQEVNETVIAPQKPLKAPKLKNKALFKRGGYAVAITAAVMAGLIILNVLLGALSKRIPLEFDMTLDKKNSISQENIDYIKSIKKDVTVTVCSKESEYATYMSSYAPQQYQIVNDYTDYYNQTVTLINLYDNYNSKIKVNFVDTQDTAFTEIASKYNKENLQYGDIIVSCGEGKEERYKIVNFQDIYTLEEDENYAMYGVSYYNIAGNNIETSLTSAISYVVSNIDKKVAFITGHSKEDFTKSYIELLETNNYEIDIISDAVVNEISSDYDAVFLVGPSTDFIPSELDVLSKFLDNDGKYGKGMVLFADAAAPYLENLYSFLEEWGIEVSEGILFETNANNYIPDQPTVLGSYAASVDDDILNGISVCITGYNVSISQGFESHNAIETAPLVVTPDSVVNAPAGTSNSWTGADKYTKESFATAIQAHRFNYDTDNNPIENYVIVFSSVDFIHSDYSETASLSNKNIAFKAAERAVGAENTGIEFVSKKIEEQSFASKVTQGSRNAVMIIFVILLPLATIAAGIYVYIRRKNA